MNPLKRLYGIQSFAVFLLFIGLGISACNTMEGAGKDIQDAGETIEDAADGDN